jgi:hypothetical protein
LKKTGKQEKTVINATGQHRRGGDMSRTININRVIYTKVTDASIIGDTPQFEVEIMCKRGEGLATGETIRLKMPIELFSHVKQIVDRNIDRHIAKADYLKGLGQ